KTMLIISHDLNTIQSISDRILLLDKGQLVGLGKPDDVVTRYKSRARSQRAEAMGREWGTGEVTLTSVELLNGAGERADRFSFGESLQARIHFDASRRIENPVFGFSVSSASGVSLYGNNTQIEKHVIPVIEGRGTLTLTLDQLAMSTGTYLLSFSVHSADHTENYHRLDHAFPIAVEAPKDFEGTYMPIRWSGP
ncbi:MAG: Wzt carbohydrate-binding domain-containing protein, partial [Verrucomicrobia bacterium]|nr:Wzt carbohydrate-binding domain-containing protein [Verrucomicrobiota bacterium]